MNAIPIVQSGDEIRWLDRRRGVCKGVIRSIRRTPRTGRLWLQVQVTPAKAGDYAGQRSVRYSRMELKK